MSESGIEWIRARIKARTIEAVHDGDLRLERFREPAGDPGLFGADSPVWRVHSHPMGMLTGGFAALMLQSLHPLAMAGVAQFSDYKADPLGRLSRTARYVTITAFGPRAEAEAAIARVRRVHQRVRGTAPDGREYRADDPELLVWVHTAEVSCFLAGHQTFAAPARRLTSAECDRYLDEVARLAVALGAEPEQVPRSRAEVAAYFGRLQPQLYATPAALEAVEFLRAFGRDPAERAATKVLMNGGISLLPQWARGRLEIRRPAPVRLGLDRRAVRALGGLLDWACGPSEILIESQQRAARPAVGAASIPEQGTAAQSSQPV